MSQKEKDVRFSKVYNDPRFRTFRKVDKTLKIDKRFKSMFTEDKFKLKYSMDKRGKNKKHLISDDYKKFYRLSDDEEEKDKDETVAERGDDQIDDSGDVPSVAEETDQVGSETSDEEEKEEEEVKKDDKPAVTKLTHKLGYHRGLNRATYEESSSSSSSESEESDEEEDLEVDHEWGELDRDADQIDDATLRIAICNADWDRINAQDLFVLLNSFKRATGAIHYVRIYYSKFGEERLQVEERKGPSEFIFGKATNVEEIAEQVAESQSEEDDDDADSGEQQESANENDEEEEEDGDDTDPKAIEKLRKYQLERLKYFYAVVEFDCPETAEMVYNELDGMEYESSSSTLDIRFIPEDMNFDDVKLKEECSSMPNSNNYIAPNFINAALQQSHVTLTWDETDHKRKSVFDQAFDKDNEDDLKAYLATSSSDDQEEEVEIDANLKDDEKINKYKDLLKSLDKDNDGDIEMEVTWDPSLKSNAESLIKKKESGASDNSKSITSKSIDNYSADSDSEVEEEEEEDEKAKPDTSKDKYKKWKKKKAAKKETDNSSANEDPSNLELLMVDMEKREGKKHFNYKEIVDSYSKKGQSKDATEEQVESKDSFKFDADDPRFGAIFSSHLYNIDQSDPSFKKTEAFDQILNRRKSKAAQLVKDEKSVVPMMEITKPAGGKSWTSLVSKVKSNTSGIDRKRPTVDSKVNANSRFSTNKKFRR